MARARQPSRVVRINSHYDPKSSPQPKFCTKRALRASLTCRCSAATLRVRGPGRPASRRSRPLLAARFDSECATHIFTCVLTRGTRQAGCGGAGRSQASVKCSLNFYPEQERRPIINALPSAAFAAAGRRRTTQRCRGTRRVGSRARGRRRASQRARSCARGRTRSHAMKL